MKTPILKSFVGMSLLTSALLLARSAEAQTPGDKIRVRPPLQTVPKDTKKTDDKKTDAEPTKTKDGKSLADTDKLPQFESAMEFEPRNPNFKVAFSLEDADLAELVRTIGQLTGKRFIFGSKVKSNIKATIYSPQKVTVGEAYQAFLSILETNGLTVIPQGRFLKIVESANASTQGTPISKGATTGEDRYVTRLHRLKSIPAEEVANLLNKFKTKDAEIVPYGPGNLLIITDTGTNIRRLISIVEEIDVGGAGDQIFMEPVHYASATEVAGRINELFDVKGGGGGKAPAGGAPGATGGGGATGVAELHIAKVLPDDRTNSLIIVSTEKAYLRMLELIKKIDVPQSSEGEIHVLPLQHADAIELSKTLNEIITGATGAGSPPPGGKPAAGASSTVSGIFEGGIKVSADKSTNSIVVTSSLRDYAQLRAVVDKLDQSRKQVFIEAVIMDLSVERQRKFGFNFHGGAQVDTVGDGQSLLLGGLNPLASAGFPLSGNDLNGLALGIRGPSIPGTEALTGGTGLSIPAFGVVLSALANSGDTDVISTPHIIATDNVAAEINIGENIPLQTNSALSALGALGGAGGTAATSALGGLGALSSLGGGTGGRTDVGTKIKITPHMNDSNEVRLELIEEISEAKAPINPNQPGSAGAIPITRRTANTQLIAQDQQTVVIGGLMRNRVAHTEKKIPLLGDIPLLGALFKTTEDTIQKSNLVLILTPHVIREQADLRKIFERKMQERQDFLDRYFVFSKEQEYEAPKDYSRMNGLLAFMHKSFVDAEEKRRLDEISRPRELKKHEPQQPLEMPTGIRAGATTTKTDAATTTAPTNQPAIRNDDAPRITAPIRAPRATKQSEPVE